MAFRLLHRAPLGLGLACTTAAGGLSLLAARPLAPLRADAPRGGPGDSIHDAARRSARRSGLDARVLRQVSTGSITGLVAGVALSVFSRPLTLLLGLVMLGAQYLESRGIRVVPYQRVQRYFKNVDVARAMGTNVAFKLSFAAMFTLAAFAEF